MATAPTLGRNTKAIALLSVAVAFWIGFIFIESVQPPVKYLVTIPQLDKIAHFGAFSILSVLVYSLFAKLRLMKGVSTFAIPLMLVMMCGVLQECIQMSVPGRKGSVLDLLVDMSGAIFAVLFIHLIRMHRKTGVAPNS